jgi:tetratricopeptide (TPR) repeat protein
VSEERASLKAQLGTARRILAVLEEQVAGYTALTVPAHLQVEMETQRDKVASLEARLAQLEGYRDAVPDNLPRRPDIFVGRTEEIRRCLEALSPDERGWGVTIDGIGGIGKTALALEVAHRAKEQAMFDAYLFASAKTTWLTPDGVRAETLALTSLDAFVREFALRLGAAERAAQPDTARPLRERFIDHWLNYARRYAGIFGGNYQTYDRLEAEWPNLEAAAELLWQTRNRDSQATEGCRIRVSEEQAQTAAHRLNDLAATLRTFLWFRGCWEERVFLNEWAYQAMASLDDWREAGWRACQAAWSHYDRTETDLADAWAERCADAWEQSGYLGDQAEANRLVARQRGNLDEAERFCVETLATARDLGDDDWVSIVLNDLGAITRQRGDYDQAETYLREGLALDEKTKDKEGQATHCGYLGELALDRAHPGEARPWLERALTLAREVGRQDLIARNMGWLARVLEAEGRLAEALPLAEEGLHIYERLGHRDLAATRDLGARLRAAAATPTDA